MPLAATLRRRLLAAGFDRDALAAEISEPGGRFLACFGRAPDFIDGHQHVHLFPQIREAVLCGGEGQRTEGLGAPMRARLAPFAARLADRKGLLLDSDEPSSAGAPPRSGLRTNPAFAGTYEFDAAARISQPLFPRFLDRLPDGSVVMCHPGFVDAELQQLDPLTTLREQEYAFLAGDAFPAALAVHGRGCWLDFRASPEGRTQNNCQSGHSAARERLPTSPSVVIGGRSRP